MMVNLLHGEFGRFHFVLEDTPTPNHYRIKPFPLFASVITPTLPSDRVITLTNHGPRFPLPDAKYLQLHAAIGNILHASGRAENIENLLRDLGETGGSVLEANNLSTSWYFSISSGDSNGPRDLYGH